MKNRNDGEHSKQNVHAISYMKKMKRQKINHDQNEDIKDGLKERKRRRKQGKFVKQEELREIETRNQVKYNK
jgi:predicted subunit of tRNA(5-methylaminomethyl-2-thiouridylate) methyltransferase